PRDRRLPRRARRPHPARGRRDRGWLGPRSARAAEPRRDRARRSLRPPVGRRAGAHRADADRPVDGIGLATMLNVGLTELALVGLICALTIAPIVVVAIVLTLAKKRSN